MKPVRITFLLLTMLHLGTWSPIAAQDRGIAVFQEWYPSKRADSTMASWSLRQGADMALPRVSKSPRGIRLLGPFDVGDALRLELKQLPRHTLLRVDIGWHIIGPWQGASSNDRFMAMVDGRSIIDATFSNTIDAQSWPNSSGTRTHPPRTRARNSNMLGYSCSYTSDYIGPMDATYETSVTIAHTSSSATLDLSSLLIHFMLDTNRKQWGLDHVVISVLDPYTESELPSRSATTTKLDVATYDGNDPREIAEFAQDEHFPGISSTSALARDLHVSYIRNECHSCGDVCLMYHYRLYTDGWLSVWSNRSPKGKATYCVQLDSIEHDSLSQLISLCVSQPLEHAYHDQTYEDTHPDLTHCELVMIVDEKELKTEVYAGEPPALRQLMKSIMSILEKRGWAPIPK
ncbi:MAG: hypothetical protein NTX15_08535 [Candidatus Kapabacteria bacterium]|nr:hypothetical protein [Candidatus Kapabacteria bacterium]